MSLQNVRWLLTWDYFGHLLRFAVMVFFHRRTINVFRGYRMLTFTSTWVTDLWIFILRKMSGWLKNRFFYRERCIAGVKSAGYETCWADFKGRALSIVMVQSCVYQGIVDSEQSCSSSATLHPDMPCYHLFVSSCLRLSHSMNDIVGDQQGTSLIFQCLCLVHISC